MKTVAYALALFFCLHLFGGCGRPITTSRDTVIQMHTNLIAECSLLVEQGVREGKDVWTSGETLPPSIRKMEPQYVKLIITSSSTVIDIQLSGGFEHKGFLVVCSSEDPAFVPSKGRGWRITRIADGIFEYTE